MEQYSLALRVPILKLLLGVLFVFRNLADLESLAIVFEFDMV